MMWKINGFYRQEFILTGIEYNFKDFRVREMFPQSIPLKHEDQKASDTVLKN